MAKSRAERAAEIQALVRAEPGIRAAEIARRCATSDATISLVITALKDAEQIEQVRDGAGRGLGLRTSVAAMRRELVRRKWR